MEKKVDAELLLPLIGIVKAMPGTAVAEAEAAAEEANAAAETAQIGRASCRERV